MSETPQMNPQQDPGRSGPTQPLPQGTPGTPGGAPAAQAPGQVPPPMPAQPPGAPSAWSQQLPAGLPQAGGPAAGRPRAGARPWLIGGGAALAVAAIAGVVIAMSGGGGKSTAAGASPGAPGGAVKPSAPGKAYTKVPEGCELIKASTIARIAPGTECKPSQFDNATMASMITRMPSWDTPFGSGGEFLSLDVSLNVSPGASGMYDMKKKSALTALDKVRTVTDQRSLSGLGEEAYVVHGADKAPMDLAEATVIVRAGNAVFTVGYTYKPADSGKTEKQAEDDAIAAARDVLGSLG
ncbi:hypothetical protein AB0I10_08020 [Streptomyces sp. NPDC050636]|uniref:hypothetical protein n=1 Tax=Streptomyces sp. NPDC050636 TaxID=3154510 RepID=UPI003447CE60